MIRSLAVPGTICLLAGSMLAGGCEKKDDTIELSCGAGLRNAVDEAVRTFTVETGIRVNVDYAGSGMQISKLKLRRDTDLFMPGDVWYVDQLAKEGLVESTTMVTYFVPVIIVRKTNPKGITGLEDFFRADLTAALGRPDACQVGRISRQIFAKNALDIDRLDPGRTMHSVTVNELGVWVTTGRADAAIVWDAIAANHADTTDIVHIPRRQNVISRVAVAVMKYSKNKQLASKFVQFLVSEKGKRIFKKHHYRIEPPQ